MTCNASQHAEKGCKVWGEALPLSPGVVGAAFHAAQTPSYQKTPWYNNEAIMERRNGQVAITTIVFGAVIVAALGGVAFAGDTVIQLLRTIFSNIFELGIFLFILVGGGFGVYNLVQRDDISNSTAAIAGVVVLGLALASPFLTSLVTEQSGEFSATVSVMTSETAFGISEVSFDGLRIDTVERTGSDVFSIQQQEACAVFCGDFEVKLTLDCSNQETRTRFVNGAGGDDPQVTFRDIAGGQSCTITGVMQKPVDHSGLRSDRVSFSTG